MNKFKKDDLVVCINTMSGLTKGKYYKVINVVIGGDVSMIYILDDTGGKFHFSEKRFISVEEHKEKLRLMLLIKTVENSDKSKKDLFLSELSFRMT